MLVNTEALIKTLGGPSVLHCTAPTIDELTASIRKGIAFKALDTLAMESAIDVDKLSTILRISPRTLARRRKSRRLAADESDRLVRLARVFAYALNVFKDQHKATTWLQRPNRALQQHAPIDLLDTDIGTQRVETILIRIHHGVYS